MGLAMLFGWIAIGYEVGKRTAAAFNIVWAPPVIAGVGTLILSLVSGILNIIPLVNCVGWFFPALMSLLGLGAVVVSRFGTSNSLPQPVVPNPPARPLPPMPPMPPSAPVKMADNDEHEDHPVI
jgi:hypothetical protein